MIELHRAPNPVRETPAEDLARELITDGRRHLAEALDELFCVGANRRAPIADALAAFRRADDALPGLTPCISIRALLGQVLNATGRSRRRSVVRRRLVRARNLAAGLLTDPHALHPRRRRAGA